MEKINLEKSRFLILAGLLLLAGGLKYILLVLNVIPFNSDEAVVALMARRILQGEFPVFFWGQAYMGSLDAFLVAGGFAIFGEQVWVIRLVQALLYIATIGMTTLIGTQSLGSWKVGWLAAFLMAVPTVNVTLYTTASLGGYGEALLIGVVSLWLGLRINQSFEKIENLYRKQIIALSLWGVLVGLGLWANALSLVFSIPVGGLILFRFLRLKRSTGNVATFLVSILTGFGIGALPWWIFAYQNGLAQLVAELAGQAVAVEQSPWLVKVGLHLFNFLVLGISAIFGFRPPWNIDWLGLPLLPFVLIFWAAVFWFTRRQLHKTAEHRSTFLVLTGVLVTLIGAFLLTSFGVDPSGRYFLPFVVPLSLFAAYQISTAKFRWEWKVALAVLVVGYQLWGTLQCVLTNPPGLTTQFYAPSIVNHNYDNDLIAFLKSEGETRGYTNYWVAYPLAFESHEELIFIPRLPYHPDLTYTARDDRFKLYTDIVRSSQKVAYISTSGADIDLALQAGFQNAGITWREKLIGDYRIYYHLSRPVSPEEVGFVEK